jgi:putative ABC transport system substrate-binding protein
MWFAVKRLWLGMLLIAAGSAVLLLTDVRRAGADGRTRPRIAIFQHASTPVLDEGVRGMIDGLAEKGYRDGETADITTYNAEGDLPTANAIAREVTDGRFDLVITSSTPSLQVVANANKAGRAKHVFGIVADPYVADVGLDRADPLRHPPHLVGQSIMLPVGDAFRVAKRMWPGLTKIGVAWNPAEPNSRMFVSKAREAAPELGIELIEAQVENTSGVTEAIHSVLGRGAQAVWVGGDNTISSVIDSVVATARQARTPVFSLLPGIADRGTIFDLGMDFYEAGRQTGRLAGEVLGGADLAAIPIRDLADVVRRRFLINLKAIRGLKGPWRVPDDLLRQADVVVDEKGIHNQGR